MLHPSRDPADSWQDEDDQWQFRTLQFDSTFLTRDNLSPPKLEKIFYESTQHCSPPF
jgi:hypothetical protein